MWLALTPEELDRQRRLSATIGYWLREQKRSAHTEALVAKLRRGGVQTLRDVLVLGLPRTATVAGLTLGRQETVAAAVEAAWPEEPLTLEEPFASRAARYCLSLDQVPAAVLPSYAAKCSLSGRDLLAPEPYTVGAVLDDPERLRASTSELVYRRIREQAVRFAAEFSASSHPVS